ncbi:MAG TPA: uroporphyrinogen-III C-methyltransferase [Candidatus Paceibacterota bacterium]|nr:uroporphyrinogen-III C-methyltransferase [Verrucomicrobiota bacterium]HRY47067.1 uroporphyrinogen-III C-methyltransferase [Candidatus Paceibacterota bacterium]
MKTTGMVYLVGAGPGDPGLLTLRGAELLGRADVVIHDGLVNLELLRLAPKGAEIVFGGKRERSRCVSQAELNQLLIGKAREGRQVVRLKGGDPYVFARGGEEAEALYEAGIPFEVVPGVSSTEAVPNYAGIPLTHRRFCSSYTVITGHTDPASAECRIDWRAVSRAEGTLVVLMGLKHLRAISDKLMEHGKPADTPAAVIRWGTWGTQQVIEGTLATLADQAEQCLLEPPVVIVMGEVVRLRARLNWLEKRRLWGQRIVVTRSRDQAPALSKPLREMGADVLEIPVIRTRPPRSLTPLREALAGLGAYDWLVFTSVNGVTRFFEEFFKKYRDLRDLGALQIAAVGPGTAARIRDYRLEVDVVPEEHTGIKIVEALEKFESLENLRFLLARAEKANPELARLLEEKGGIVDDIACYRTEPEPDCASADVRRFRQEGADWILFTSGSTVEQFHARFDLPGLMRQFPGLKLATIGPETTRLLNAVGLTPALEADPHTVDGLLAALRDFSNGDKSPKINESAG